MRQNSDLITAVQTLTVTTVYTAAGTNFPSSSSYHSTKAQSPQSAELAGVTVPQPQTAHTHAYEHTHMHMHTHTCICTHGKYRGRLWWDSYSFYCIAPVSWHCECRVFFIVFGLQSGFVAPPSHLQPCQPTCFCFQKLLHVGLISLCLLAKSLSPPLCCRSQHSNCLAARRQASPTISKHSQL